MSKEFKDDDTNASKRKSDHIQLAFESKVVSQNIDNRFYYEPVLSGHPIDDTILKSRFLDSDFDIPIWISSMTGGTGHASTINKNLARACKEYKMGMGLGSCRSLLTSDENLPDFNVRPIIGDQPLYANLGVAQVEQLIKENKLSLINKMLEKLDADGLIVHVNPLQEWMQPEGDRYHMSPLDIITAVLDRVKVKVIVKEVGQGMGIKSLTALFQLPLEAVDFAASGGTNFALLELLRQDKEKSEGFMPLVYVGHSAEDMVDMTNQIKESLGHEMKCKQVIISGGVENFLDGYYLIKKCKLPAVYGKASAFLKYAMGDYEELQSYIETQKSGLLMAYSYLNIR
jgi:isopentenyl-diphosphate delta-isomerase